MRRSFLLVMGLGLAGCQSPAGALPDASASPPPPPPPLPSPPPPAASSAAAPAGPCPEGMALIPGGAYRMQKRHRQVTVAAFCLDRTEVTVAAYKVCVREGKCSPECIALKQCSAVPTQASWGDPQESLRASKYCNGDRDERQDHPVNCVSLEEAANYCESYQRRLPSPEEWEWAALGADATARYPWGLGEPKDQLCWGPKARRREGTCAAGSVATDRTPQGVFDLGGNVSEWVQAKGADGGVTPMAFGASWYAMDDGYVRAALGGIETPSARNETVGFRCAREVLR